MKVFLALIFVLVSVGETLGEIKASPIVKRWQETPIKASDAEKPVKPPNFVAEGKNTTISKYPFQATLLIEFAGNFYHLCGAVLINRWSVITVAHCTVYMNEYQHYVALGINDLSLGLANPGSQLLLVTDVLVHNRYMGYAGSSYPNDIALLTLNSKVKYNKFVKPAKLTKPLSSPLPGKSCYVTGWGLDENFERPTILQEGYQVVISNRICRKLWSVNPYVQVFRRHICSTFFPVSACFGDGGGPLTCDNRVAGLVSWGETNCTGCLPVISTRISTLWNWIQRKL